MGVERRAVGLLPAAVLTLLTATFPLPAGAGDAGPLATPRAVCGPGSLPGKGMQGRMTAADYALGVRCNLELVGRAGPGIGGFRTHRYVDPQGHECAYYDRFPGAPSNPGVALGERPYRACPPRPSPPSGTRSGTPTATTASSP